MTHRDRIGHVLVVLLVASVLSAVLWVTGRQDARSAEAKAGAKASGADRQGTDDDRSSGAWSSSNAYATTPPAQDATLPPLGPGAVLEPDLSVAPQLPDGMAASEYVTNYFQRVLAGDLEGAWAMLPKTPGEATLEDFQRLLAPYQPEGFWIRDATSAEGSEEVTVLQFDPDNRSWNTTWTFVDTKRGRVLKDVIYALPSGGACH